MIDYAVSRTVLAIRQLNFKGLGGLELVFAGMGYDIRYLDAPNDDLTAVDAGEDDLMVVLGGPPSALDDRRYPFLIDELRLIEQRLASGRPLLGICLGAQLLARTLGASIHEGAAEELGWWPVQLSQEGRAGPLRFLDQVPVLHWHRDAMALPEGARRLAWTDDCDVQAFSWGDAVMGLQFHPEVDCTAMNQWLVAHVSQLDAHPLQSVERLREQTQRCSPWMQRRASAMLSDWLAGLDERRLLRGAVRGSG
ncbi:glutamine amidotransferase [Gammaproteobacteria bacterium AB-CW1]|uniref:Glutamine amidotransferase n=1 Tax=Natronospira elongata TaxID=3110268 RepID=A0AAP6MK36_9GAMM|nr:glutamine amidotransferase [Gammaproteobacteria bacterium AB-CW1]